MEAMDIFLATTRDISYLIVYHPIYSALGSVVVLLGLLRFYCRLTLGVCNCDVDMSGKTVLITGATSGIGKETALELARRNARVLLACRNREKALKVAEEIISITSNQKVIVKDLDLCSFESVRKCAREILDTEEHLHVLINNAGITGVRDQMTEDNCNKTMQANYFGHFLLTLLLVDLMKRSSPSRIINVSSQAYQLSSLDLDDLNNTKNSHPLLLYGNSKLANILFTKELAEKLANSGVTVNALHPGVVQTDIMREGEGLFPIVTQLILLICGKSPGEGAQTSIHLSVSPSLSKTTGKYFLDCKEEPLTQKGVDRSLAKRLFEKSQRIVGHGSTSSKGGPELLL